MWSKSLPCICDMCKDNKVEFYSILFYSQNQKNHKSTKKVKSLGKQPREPDAN